MGARHNHATQVIASLLAAALLSMGAGGTAHADIHYIDLGDAVTGQWYTHFYLDLDLDGQPDFIVYVSSWGVELNTVAGGHVWPRVGSATEYGIAVPAGYVLSTTDESYYGWPIVLYRPPSYYPEPYPEYSPWQPGETRFILFMANAENPKYGWIRVTRNVAGGETHFVFHDAALFDADSLPLVAGETGPDFCVPSFLRQPDQPHAALGAPLRLSAWAMGNAVTYRWYRDGTPLVNSNRIHGADSSTLTISTLTTRDVGTYTLEAISSCATAQSEPVIVSADLPTASVLVQAVNFGPLSPYTELGLDLDGDGFGDIDVLLWDGPFGDQSTWTSAVLMSYRSIDMTEAMPLGAGSPLFDADTSWVSGSEATFATNQSDSPILRFGGTAVIGFRYWSGDDARYGWIRVSQTGSEIRVDECAIEQVPNVPIIGGRGVPGTPDIDGDGDVGLADLATLLGSFGACDADSSLDPSADLNFDACVDLYDLAVLLAHFGS